MTPFLAPRNNLMNSRPSSATPLSSYKTQRSTTKTVHFEDEVNKGPRSPLGRSVSAGKGKGKRFLFPRKKQHSEEKHGGDKKNSKGSKNRPRSLDREKKRGRSKSPELSRRSHSPPPGSESPTSVRSAPSSTIDRNQLKPHHHYFLPPSPLQNIGNGVSTLDDSRLSNVYDLFAVCNHSGTLSRGHYTAFCKNPADGHWYNYDDSSVQPITEDQLVTSGAYMLFYVRQSLLSSSPLSSSESSQSSCNSAGNHWIYHMPPFKLDLNDYHDKLCQLQQQVQQQQQQQHQFSQQSNDNYLSFSASGSDVNPRVARLNSSNSVLSNPCNVGVHISPPVSAHDVDSFASPGSGSVVNNNSHYSANHDARSDAFSAISLPAYSQSHGVYHTPPASVIAAPSYKHAVSYPSRSGGNTRHQSLRLKERDGVGWGGGERGGWAGRMPQSSQRGYPTQRSHEDLQSKPSSEVYSRNIHSYVAPTRSIPTLPTHEEMIQTPNRYSHEPLRSFTTPQISHLTTPPYHHQQSTTSNGPNIPVNIGTHYKSPSIARPSNQPESHV